MDDSVSLIDHSNRRRTSVPKSRRSVFPPYLSAARTDVALLASAFFLQRFTLPFGNTLLALDLVPSVFILLRQFLRGSLVVEYDRLLWFIPVALLSSGSLLLNFDHSSIASYLLFLSLCSLLTLKISSGDDDYDATLLSFQYLVMFLSCLAVFQFVAQFVVSGYKIIMFFGIIPDVFLHAAANTTHPVEGSSFLKSNGIFLAEPSNLTQVAALGILIEILKFRRPHYLVVMMLGCLLAYSGAGMVTLLVGLPLVGFRDSRAAFSVILVGIFALGLFATGVIDYTVFQSRTAELQTTGTSGFGRFVGPFWLAGKFLSTGPLQALLIGAGPGAKTQLSDVWYGGASGWLKELFEYGLIGSFVLVGFLVSCIRRSSCPRAVVVAVLFNYFFNADFLTTWMCTIVIVLCTLHEFRPERTLSSAQIQFASRALNPSGR